MLYTQHFIRTIIIIRHQLSSSSSIIQLKGNAEVNSRTNIENSGENKIEKHFFRKGKLHQIKRSKEKI